MGALAQPTRSLSSACDRRWSIIKYAAASRVAALVLALVSNAIVDDYDASASISIPATSSALQNALHGLVRVCVRWDAVYMVHIADVGYVHEQEHAFFPLLPLLMRAVANTVLAPLTACVDRRLALALAGVIISNASFVLAAVTLYALGRATLRSERLAYIAALLFAAAPSNMFMSAIYTESLFAWLVFSALLLIAQRRHAWAALCLCASGLCRSNGVVYAGFFVWDLVVCSDAWRGRRRLALALQMAHAAALVVVSALGFVAFQVYGYRTYCMLQSEGSVPRPYCSSAVPSIYSFVQAEYWDVGFLRYYTMQQVPNFALAAPMVALSLAGLWAYVAHDPLRVAALGWRQLRRKRADSESAPLASAFFGRALLPHMYLWALLLWVATTTMHVQVVTRFFSSVPAVFWFAAHAVADRGGAAWRRRAVAGFFVAYGLAGVALFSNFFPPA
ncbi:ER membrane glycoprotein subunit of the GPI transamidase complex-like protein [Coemansia thaxteri]|uniref:GPI mannosyltransferase 2 n=1 Tax=Coemansia thaxteri TaxID=2663907 RepID=A0A9W8BEJ3_9FUNG|nr:ER membrane glycoprotein subunit of the GPI transamidase complex-like protein [Coemansia thaxteri]